MKKNGIITLLALAAVLFLMGCKQATTADVWTELTPDNIETEIAKYDGNFKSEKDTSGQNFIFFDAKTKEIGFGDTLAAAKQHKGNAVKTLESVSTSGKIYGNGGSKIKAVIKDEKDQPVEFIYIKQ